LSVTTVRPDATINLGSAALVGAATAHQATSDDSDSSYITTGGVPTVLGFAEPSIPGGAMVVSIALRGRCTLVIPGGAAATVEVFINPAGVSNRLVFTWGSITAITLATAPTDTAVNIEAQLGYYNNETSGLSRFYELYADVAYVELPTVDPTAPTGTLIDTDLPTVEWTPTLDDDGGPQTHFEVKVFDDATYLGAGFSADASTPIASSGIVESGASSWEIDGRDLDDNSLADDTYRAYVRIAQTVNGQRFWSAWAFEPFTLDVDRPEAPSLLLTPESASGRMRLRIA
jgi:hypothetical protein